MRADGTDVGHLPRTRFIAVRAGSERADRANVDAHAALFAVQVILLVGRDHGAGAAILNAQGPDVHAFAADAHAAIAEDAAGTIEENDGRPLLFFAMLLDLDEFRFTCAILEGHVLQFALA